MRGTCLFPMKTYLSLKINSKKITSILQKEQPMMLKQPWELCTIGKEYFSSGTAFVYEL